MRCSNPQAGREAAARRLPARTIAHLFARDADGVTRQGRAGIRSSRACNSPDHFFPTLDHFHGPPGEIHSIARRFNVIARRIRAGGNRGAAVGAHGGSYEDRSRAVRPILLRPPSADSSRNRFSNAPSRVGLFASSDRTAACRASSRFIRGSSSILVSKSGSL